MIEVAPSTKGFAKDPDAVPVTGTFELLLPWLDSKALASDKCPDRDTGREGSQLFVNIN